MSEIKNIIHEDGVDEIFRLIVHSGQYAGTYEIEKPDGWDEIDSKIDINEDYFNIDNFIIGESEKINFYEYSNPKTFSLIKNVYEENLGDGQIIFKWLAKKGNDVIDILGDNFEINLNKYSESYEKSKRKIEVEIKKRESQSKFLNREETTVNLFDNKNIDGNDITPVETFTVGFKKGDRVLSNFYTMDITSPVNQLTPAKYHMPTFLRSEDFEFGTNKNNEAGYVDYNFGSLRYLGPFVSTIILLKSVKIEISNFDIVISNSISTPKPSTLLAIIDVGATRIREIPLKNSESISPGDTATRIKIENETFEIGNLEAGQTLHFVIATDDGSSFVTTALNTNTTIEITTDLSSPLVRSEAVRIKDALNQICKNYSDGGLTVESSILSMGGYYFNTSVSTGIYLRGLPPKYIVGQKIKTSFKSLFYEGAAPLLALGYDIDNEKVIIEDIGYFFKDIQSYDLSYKDFREDDYKIENDKSLSFNQLLFGSKKYSTQVKRDIENFNTKLEASTPIITSKDKFDKQTDLIIDSFKIQELIEDNSASTNDNDDDMVLIDMVNVTDNWDEAVFENTFHENDGGVLKLTCLSTPFDTTFIEVGSLITITEGVNSGTYTVIFLDNAVIKVNKTSGIWMGTFDTPIKYKISALTKNRTGVDGEGFTNPENVGELHSSTNLRHNPKFQLARWFSFFGSGLTKKSGDKEIKITDYKNNDQATMQAVSPDIANELQGLVKVGANEPLSRLRAQYETFFNGKSIEITLTNVTFHEFLDLYKCWHSGLDSDRMKGRGYITINSPEGIINIHPFGKGGFIHKRATNELTLKGKIKGIFVPKPKLNSVLQINSNTIKLAWDYSEQYINPTINIQYSLDDVNWTTIEAVTNIKEYELTYSDFDNVMTGEQVSFRIQLNTSDFTNKNSDSITKTWMYNDYVINEVYTNYTDCGDINSTIEIKGVIDFDIDWELYSFPGGGSVIVKDNDDTIITSLVTDYGYEDNKTATTSHSVNGSLLLIVNIKQTNKDADNHNLLCDGGTVNVDTYTSLNLKFRNGPEVIIEEIVLENTFSKGYYDRPIIID